MPQGKCPSCSTELIPDRRFCFKCGTELIKKKPPLCICGVELIKGKKFCYNCGISLITSSSGFSEIKDEIPPPPKIKFQEEKLKTLPEPPVIKQPVSHDTEEDEIYSSTEKLSSDELIKKSESMKEESNLDNLPTEKMGSEQLDSGYTLIIISGLEKGRNIELNKPLFPLGKLTGEKKEGWILLDSSSISNQQAIIKWNPLAGKFGIVHKKGTITPTFVNDKEISGEEFTLLEEGDIIRVGNIKMMVSRTGEEVPCSGEQNIVPAKHVFGGSGHTPVSEEEISDRGNLIKSDIPFSKAQEEKPDVPEEYDDEKTVFLRKTPSINYDIHIIEGIDKGNIIPLDKEVHQIGRRSRKGGTPKEIELSENDRSISRTHARIEKKKEKFYLIKEKAETITLLNGIQLQMDTPMELKEEDKIKIGDQTILLFKRRNI